MTIEFHPLSMLNPNIYKQGVPYPQQYSPIAKEIAKLVGACIMNYSTVNFWGKFKETGYCRAAAITKNGNIVFGKSEYKNHHAEEEIILQIKNDGNDFKYMYCDIEPCHSGKYTKHGCKSLLMETFPKSNGVVFYLFDQDAYDRGMIKQYTSSFDGVQTEIQGIRANYLGILG